MAASACQNEVTTGEIVIDDTELGQTAVEINRCDRTFDSEPTHKGFRDEYRMEYEAELRNAAGMT